MKNFLNSEKSVRLFVIIAVVSFFVLLFSFSFLRLFVFEKLNIFLTSGEISEENEAGITNKVLKKEQKDPFITKNPAMSDLLVTPIIDDKSPSIGSSDALVNIVEFSDFGCEYCREQEIVIRELLEKYKGKVRLIWKDYPDTLLESESFEASIAGRCAFYQNKFWEFHDIIFDSSKSLNKELFIQTAREIKLDVLAFEECLDSEQAFKDLVKLIKEAEALRINGVPFIFVNDQEIFGQINKDELERIIKIKLK